MAVYYVDPVNGNNANNGLGSDASHASNKPFATIGKLIAAAGAMGTGGDTAYLAPGTYRESVTAGITSPTVTTPIIGDPSNAQGFKTSGGVLVAPGQVVWTAYTTNDVSAPAAAATLILNGRDFFSFQNIVFVGGNANPTCVNASTTHSSDITFTNCAFILVMANRGIQVNASADTALNWTIDRCTFFGPISASSAMVHVIGTLSAAADYDLNILVRNCRLVGGTSGSSHCITLNTTGAGAFKPGGLDVLNCTIATAGVGVSTLAATSTSIPCTVNNCAIVAASALSANASGQITEDYCWINAGTARTNVSAGANSISGNPPASAPLFEVGQADLMGFAQRPFLAPMIGSPLLNFNGTGAPSVDLLNRPRPAGSGLAASAGVNVAVGALERHDTATPQSGSGADGGSGGYYQQVGPADDDFEVAVDAVATVISVKADWDSNHGDTNKPQAVLLDAPEIGVSTQTVTASGTAAGGYSTLTFSSFTPTAKGVVIVRLRSRSAAGNGICNWDTVGIA